MKYGITVRRAKITKPAPIGVGIQYNPEMLDWFPFEELEVDFFEVLLDNVMGPLDGPHVIKPPAQKALERLSLKCPLLAHSNYGCEFGFGPLNGTPAVRRHVAIAKAIHSPWVADQCFYSDDSWRDSWSSPLQFSYAEVVRCANRAAELQALYGIPLAHENAAYYLACPGAEMHEAEFMARLVERAGTFLHLDLHNIHANAQNIAGFDLEDYLDTIPLDRVIAAHLAGGRCFDGSYHGWHDSPIPPQVWELYEEVLSRATPSAVILEYQGRAHHPDTRILGGASDGDIIRQDLARARAIWRRYRAAETNDDTAERAA
jgi:uncharacterized protein (UPF0276 family)